MFNKQRRILISKRRLMLFLLVMFCSGIVFVRMVFAGSQFSYDYSAYLSIIAAHSNLTYTGIFRDNIAFPYVRAENFVPIELGFSFLVKTISIFVKDTELVFAILSSTSVAIRVYAMRSAGMPILWILWANVFIIVLLEANALRLGIASSLLLLGLLRIGRSLHVSGVVVMILSALFHLQVLVFIAPFLAAYYFPLRLNRSKIWVLFAISVAVAITFISIQFLYLVPNEKLQSYLAKGSSNSAGLSVTSALTILLILASAWAFKQRHIVNSDSHFFASILLAFVPSTVFFIFLTDVAVIGDRSWQLALVVFITFFFCNWTSASARRAPLVVLLVLTLIVQINVTVRYPLSNLISPPLPSIDYSTNST